MPNDELLARVYHFVLSGFVRDGRAPHYTTLALSWALQQMRRSTFSEAF